MKAIVLHLPGNSSCNRVKDLEIKDPTIFSQSSDLGSAATSTNLISAKDKYTL